MQMIEFTNEQLDEFLKLQKKDMIFSLINIVSVNDYKCEDFNFVIDAKSEFNFIMFNLENIFEVKIETMRHTEAHKIVIVAFVKNHRESISETLIIKLKP